MTPLGSVDSLTGGEGEVLIRGWAFDPDEPKEPLSVDVYIGGRSNAPGTESFRITGNSSRPDVADTHPEASPNQGFEGVLSTSKRGRQEVCVYALDFQGGTNPLLACETLTITEPTSPPPKIDAPTCVVEDSPEKYAYFRYSWPQEASATQYDHQHSAALSENWFTSTVSFGNLAYGAGGLRVRVRAVNAAGAGPVSDWSEPCPVQPDRDRDSLPDLVDECPTVAGPVSLDGCPDQITTPPTAICNGLEATITGTSGNDTLQGTPGVDVIAALQGDDIVRGLGGDDIICGGKGDDQIFGGQGFDVLFGAQGDDLLVAADHIDGDSDTKGSRMFGGAGDDSIHGTDRWDRMQGGPGNDRLYGYQGRDWIRGGAGRDQIYGGRNIDDVHGGNGNDTIFVWGQDKIRGGAGLYDRCLAIGGTKIPASAKSCERRT